MSRVPVVSSNVASVGYDPQTRILEIEFLNRSIYRYYSVPQSEYHALMRAPSVGHYFDANIKKGGYRYTKVL
jgi:hypothetical protein